MGVYDVILGMDWLCENRAIIECYARLVKFQPFLERSVIKKGREGTGTQEGNIWQVAELSEVEAKLMNTLVVWE